MRPNIVWICLDTARADALEPYGAPVGASPAIADLARRGHAHRDVRSTACWTYPAHVSMFAGGLPRELGLANQVGLHPGTSGPIVEALLDRWLPEVLRSFGYRTGAVSSNTWISRTSGFASGFDRFVEAAPARVKQMSLPDLRSRLAWGWEVARARVDDGAAEAERVLRGWIDERTTDPFFWFVNLVECHSPYLPPQPYGLRSLRQRVKAGQEAREHLTMEAVWRSCVTGEIPDDDALERMRSGYRGAIRYMDDWCARLFEALDAAGVLDETLVIVSSDHGENFGEGGLMAHAFSLDERLLQVPFVAAGPGADRLAVASFAELPARLADLAGVPDHPFGEHDPLPLPVAQFDPPVSPVTDERTQRVATRWGLDDAAVARMTMPLTAVVDGTVKLVHSGDSETFHDLAVDPLELEPLGADQIDPDVVARLRSVATAAAERAIDARPVPALEQPAELPEDELAAIEERMRLLGYM